MKRIFLITTVLSLAVPLGAQKVITLYQCYDSAAVATPLAREPELYGEMYDLRNSNLGSNWLPGLDLNGSYAYYSDIPDVEAIFGSLPVPPGTAPTIPHQLYKTTLDLNQVIWDGGVTRSARAVEEAVRELNLKQNEAAVYRLHEQVNNYYFSILLAGSQAEITGLLISDLDARIREATSGVANGVVPQVTVDVLTAEKIKAGQSLTEIRKREKAFLDALSQITGMKLQSSDTFLLPETVITGDEEINNPDIQLFEVQKRKLEMSKDLLRNQRMPKAFGFAQAGYGLPPGNNFFAETPDPYFSVGVGFKWTIFDWNKSSKERKVLTVQQELAEVNRSAAEEAYRRALMLKMAEIESLKEAAVSDEELIALRGRIAAVAASQLGNGTITASQYMTELTSEKQAIATAEMRKISIARAQVDYVNIIGFKKQ